MFWLKALAGWLALSVFVSPILGKLMAALAQTHSAFEADRLTQAVRSSWTQGDSNP